MSEGVLINHSWEDEDRALAAHIHDVLRMGKMGSWEPDYPWLKADDIEWMNRALLKASCVVTLWTPNSVRSNWVIAAAKVAFKRRTMVSVAIGITVEEIPPPFNSGETLISHYILTAEDVKALIDAARSRLLETSTRPADDQELWLLEEAEWEFRYPPNERLQGSDGLDVLPPPPANRPGPEPQIQPASHKAFVSYASEDQEIAVELVKHLEGTDCPCWIAFRDADPGMDYRVSILTAIKQVRCLVLLYSTHVNTSFDIATELLLVRRQNKTRFVIKIDASEPDGPVEYELATVQWVDGQKDRTQALARIAQSARIL
jgi:TIR domain